MIPLVSGQEIAFEGTAAMRAAADEMDAATEYRSMRLKDICFLIGIPAPEGLKIADAYMGYDLNIRLPRGVEDPTGIYKEMMEPEGYVTLLALVDGIVHPMSGRALRQLMRILGIGGSMIGKLTCAGACFIGELARESDKSIEMMIRHEGRSYRKICTVTTRRVKRSTFRLTADRAERFCPAGISGSLYDKGMGIRIQYPGGPVLDLYDYDIDDTERGAAIGYIYHGIPLIWRTYGRKVTDDELAGDLERMTRTVTVARSQSVPVGRMKITAAEKARCDSWERFGQIWRGHAEDERVRMSVILGEEMLTA